MKRILFVTLQTTVLLTVVLLTACSAGDQAPTPYPGPTFPPPTSAAPPAVDSAPPAEPTAEQPPAPERVINDREIAPPGLVQDSTDLVAGSGTCSACHSNLRSDTGENISFDDLWRSSMMAHAAKDPYWQAAVSAETAEFPELKEVIAEKCSTCHMPLARFDALTNGETPLILEDGFSDPDNQLHDLAMDGVSCTLCHQITGDNFGQKDSYSGHYLIDQENRDFGDRLSFGPLPITETNVQIMAGASGYTAVESQHTADADLCGTCHNLYTPYLNSAGEIAGEFPEQTAHLEWENSAFADGSCTDCHMPEVTNVKIANIAAEPQPYLRQHTFAGANAYMLTLLNDNASETGITAETQQMQSALERISATMESGQDITIGAVTLEGGLLTAEAIVSNPNGHKRPASFPSRRIWVHMWVEDTNGTVLLESGAYDDTGFITGNDNDLDPALYEPHYQRIDSPDQVQIYEAIMHNTDMEVTTTLLRAAGYAKDNRLLPLGFPVDNPPADIAVYGSATEDPDFTAGQDTIRYVVDVSEAKGPFTLHFELLYQTIAYRWAENLRQYDTNQTVTFLGYYDDSSRLPVVLGKVETVKQ